ncbi:uncharacterized protein LOC129956565 [Argiope bruennichi]|uniref:uncharacterized protein LOC129956565 n=1 Tax=Argiope bruennichi TaxID=94029 RepID=UPI00249563EE|nr:uncharacterized protein LOC129956565 [Argiope bruennichi]
MSSGDKIPLLNQSSSESSESHSESGVEKAEENLEHLQLQERLVKGNWYVESSSSDSSIQERNTESTDVPMTVPIEESRPPFADVKSDPAPKRVRALDLQREAAEAQRAGENTETTDSTPPFIQSPPTSESSEKLVPPPIPPRKHYAIQKLLHSQASSNNSAASDRQTTLYGVPSIVSEVASYSGEEIPYDESANYQEDQTSNDAPELGRQLSEASDSNISDIPDEYQAPPPPTPISSREYGEPTVAQLQREEDIKVGTSLGIVSSKQDELEDVHPKSELSEGRLFSKEKDVDKLTKCEQRPKGNEQELSELEDMPNVSIGLQTDEERIQFSEFGAGSPSDRRGPSKYEAGQSSGGKRDISRLNPETKLDVEEKVGSKTNDPVQSGDELHHRELSEMKGSNVSPKLKTDKKHWQKAGGLLGMQLTAVTSKDSAVAEEADPISPCEAQIPEPMETGGNDDSPEKMSTTADESVAADTGLPESNPTLKSRDRVNISETEGVSKEEQTSKKGVFQRKAKKYKLPDAKTSSPPSDETRGSSPKKARPDLELKRTHRTRHDSSNKPGYVNLGYVHEKSSTSDEEETDQ